MAAASKLAPTHVSLPEQVRRLIYGEMTLEETLMDMRRASDKDGLHDKQEAAMRLLLDIQTGYRDFHSQSLERIGMHPGAVAGELGEAHSTQ